MTVLLGVLGDFHAAKNWDKEKHSESIKDHERPIVPAGGRKSYSFPWHISGTNMQ